jgi:hypothetical protein
MSNQTDKYVKRIMKPQGSSNEPEIALESPLEEENCHEKYSPEVSAAIKSS